MKTQNPLILSAKFVAKDMIGDILYWPVWWYSVGLVSFVKRRVKSVGRFQDEIGLAVWINNWTKPMYGQYDFAGKAISLIMRTFFIVFKIIFLLGYSILQLFLVFIWLALPLLALWQLWLSLS